MDNSVTTTEATSKFCLAKNDKTVLDTSFVELKKHLKEILELSFKLEAQAEEKAPISVSVLYNLAQKTVIELTNCLWDMEAKYNKPTDWKPEDFRGLAEKLTQYKVNSECMSAIGFKLIIVYDQDIKNHRQRK